MRREIVIASITIGILAIILLVGRTWFQKETGHDRPGSSRKVDKIPLKERSASLPEGSRSDVGGVIEQDVTDTPLTSDQGETKQEVASQTSEGSEVSDQGWPEDDPPPELEPSFDQPKREFARKHWNEPRVREAWHRSQEELTEMFRAELSKVSTLIPILQVLDQEIMALGGVKLRGESNPRVEELVKQGDRYIQEMMGIYGILQDKETVDILGSWPMEEGRWVIEYLHTTPPWWQEELRQEELREELRRERERQRIRE